MSYLTPQARGGVTTEVMGSRFIAVVAPIDSAAEASLLLAESQAEHPDASHHCWAFRFDDIMRFSDDGEPGGTAGRPMLEVMLKRELNRCAAVVVRYFGGRKLGAGGLVRAYSGAVARAFDAVGVREVRPRVTLRIKAPFAFADAVLRALDGAEAGFDEKGLVATVTVDAAARSALETRLAELTRGEATVKPTVEPTVEPTAAPTVEPTVELTVESALEAPEEA